jgi:hypothetical protein
MSSDVGLHFERENASSYVFYILLNNDVLICFIIAYIDF